MPPALEDYSEDELPRSGARSYEDDTDGQDRDQDQYSDTNSEPDAKAQSGVKKQRNGSARGDGKDGDEDENEDEEEFVVERIIDHVIEKDGEPRFRVKWEGWDDPEDLTWEPMDNLGTAPEVLEAYFKKIGGREAMWDKPVPKKTKKRSRKSTSVGATASDSGSQASSVKRARKSAATHPADSTPPRKERARPFVPPAGSWEDHVDNIDAIQDNDGGLIIYLTWKNGTKTRHDTKAVYKRCPQMMLRFYERHIKIISTSNKNKENGDENIEDAED